MSCERYHETIGAWVDGTLDVVERREIEDHLAVCAGCSALARDLERLRALAQNLDRLTPPDALWNRIAAETEASPRGPSRRVWTVWMPLAAAAVVLLAVALSFWRPAGSSFGASTEAPPASASREEPEMSAVDLANSVEAELRLAEQHYENAIAGLERLARDRQILDPQVAATLHRNLQVIDTAIGESRAALRAQPASDSAQQSLFDAFRTKIALLEDTIALLNELRQTRERNSAAPAGGGEPL
jgi:anti-sigma factor RsiW